MFLSQCTPYDTIYAVNQTARAMSKPSKLRMAAAKNLLLYPKVNMPLVMTCKTGCFEFSGYQDASWGTTELQDCAPERDGAVYSGGGALLNGTRKQGGGVSI